MIELIPPGQVILLRALKVQSPPSPTKSQITFPKLDIRGCQESMSKSIEEDEEEDIAARIVKGKQGF